MILIPNIALAERPFLRLETAIPTQRGTYRLESGLTLNRLSTNHKRTELNVGLRYGLIQNLELDLEAPLLFVSNNGQNKNRLGDLLLKTKIRFIKGRVANPLSIAGQMIIKFPTAGKESLLGTTGVVDIGFLAIASKTFSPATAHINFGYYFIGNPESGNKSDQVRYALGLNFNVTDSPLQLIAEIFGQSDTSSSSPTTPDTSVAMGGFSLRAREDIKIDTTVGFGLNQESPDYIINLGGTYIFE